MSGYQRVPSTHKNEMLYRSAVSDVIASLSGEVFVDLGCGDGSHTASLGALMDASQIVGLDHDFSHLSSMNAAMTFVEADLNQDLPFSSASVDVILANQVIEHVWKTDLFVSEIRRVLVPDGSIVICTPNIASWHNIFALWLGYIPFSAQISDQAFLGNPLHPLYKQKIAEAQAHLRMFTFRGLRDLLTYHGLFVQREIPVGFYPFGGVAARILARVDWRHCAYVLTVATKRA